MESTKKNQNVAKNQATEMPKTDHLAMEMIRDERRASKAKDFGIGCLTVAVIIIAIGMAVINYRNDMDWRSLFSEYDFVSQDGSGINSINTGEQGDLNNGATGEAEEEQINR